MNSTRTMCLKLSKFRPDMDILWPLVKKETSTPSDSISKDSSVLAIENAGSSLLS